jgi:putative ABC transport system permease protein
MATERFATLLLIGFAASALLLAFIGVYGVTDQLVCQRTQELGVRVALGARPIELIRLTIAGALRLAAVGTLAGAVAACALATILSSLLYGTSARDPIVFITVAVVLVAAAALAATAPALRAARVDPAIALRAE